MDTNSKVMIAIAVVLMLLMALVLGVDSPFDREFDEQMDSNPGRLTELFSRPLELAEVTWEKCGDEASESGQIWIAAGNPCTMRVESTLIPMMRLATFRLDAGQRVLIDVEIGDAASFKAKLPSGDPPDWTFRVPPSVVALELVCVGSAAPCQVQLNPIAE